MNSKMKYLFINSVAGSGSTGRIAADECRRLRSEGHECVIAYGRRKNNCDDIQTVRIGTEFDCNMHGIFTRLFDMHGFCSKKATAEFLEWVEKYDPDVIWLHNIHGYYINIEMLFGYLKSCGKTIKWTLHDCWAFTGHCAYFTDVKCDKWKTKCSHCPQLRRYPKCSFIGNVEKNFERKRKAFTEVPNLTLITPSKWLADLTRQSFLKEYPVEVVYNKIDTNVFKPTPSNFRSKYGLEGKIILLGVANVWEERKGLDDFYKLACMLDENYAIVLVGLNKKQIKKLPDEIIGIEKTDSPEELSAIYTASDVFVNPSKEETFGMTTLEAVSCGTEAIVYEGTGCEEVVHEFGGAAVKPGVENLYKAITGHKYCQKFPSER